MSSQEIVVSAPGKVILHGEHAVVFGKTALAACLNLRTTLHLQQSNDGYINLDLPDIGVKRSWPIEEIKDMYQLPFCDPLNPMPPPDDLEAKLKKFAGVDESTVDTKSLAVVSFLYLYGSLTTLNGNPPSLTVRICSKLPTSAGLGSSAAYSVCLSSSLLRLSDYISNPVKDCHSDEVAGSEAELTHACDEETMRQWSEQDLELINKWAYQAEKIIHGKPSGIDNSVSTYGGAIEFQKGTITNIKKVPKLRILLINTKVPRSTKILVANVGEKYNKYPEILGPVLESIEAISRKCKEILGEMATGTLEEHYQILEDLIDINQQHLKVLGVSHPALETICYATHKYGLHSKLTGAGGGGCAFTLLRTDINDHVMAHLRKDLQELGFDCWETTVGGSGVLQHRLY